MPTIYSFRFDHGGKEILVHFVDKCLDLDKTEALSQIDHASRRRWAIESIQLMNRADKLHWINFPVQHDMECLFGKRLMEEHWNNSTAFLMLADNQISFYINRSFILFYLHEQAICFNCHRLQLM